MLLFQSFRLRAAPAGTSLQFTGVGTKDIDYLRTPWSMKHRSLYTPHERSPDMPRDNPLITKFALEATQHKPLSTSSFLLALRKDICIPSSNSVRPNRWSYAPSDPANIIPK